jgi:cysteine desulfurase/selenocysteine lyase
MDIREARALFPGTEEHIYLDAGVRGLVPTPTREAAEAHLALRVMGTGDKDEIRAGVERTRASFASLIGAAPEEVAITKNVSEGLNLFASSLPWESGDNVVFCPELEHPNNVFLWYNLRKLRGVEARVIEPDEGRVPVEWMVAAMDERTRVVTVPHISFSPGFITDVETLVEAAHARNVLVLVDAAQSVGAIRSNVREMNVDALAVATQKCLLSMYGLGFLYIRRELADTLIPGHVARYGIDLGPDAHETALGDEDLQYQPGALRFDLGNYNYLGAEAAGASLDLIASVGMDSIESHVRRLAARLAEGFLDLGLPVAGGPPGPHLAHIVAVGQSGGGRHYTADDPAMNDLHRHLRENGVRLSIRRGVLRMTVALYNSEEEVDRVVELAREWIKS